MGNELIAPGIYNIEYFSGSQVAIYIGDVMVDEVTSMQFSVRQNKQPLYGYADTLFRTVSKGQVLVQGSFTINFKEAGYLWLILNEYNKKRGLPDKLKPITSSQDIERKNIERFVDGETDTYADRNQLLSNLAAQAALTGFASNQRLVGTAGFDSSFVGPPGPGDTGLGAAENSFERFENLLWSSDQSVLDESARRADDPSLNDFDIYVAFGDFAGNDRHNHTIQKLSSVHILGTSKVIQVDGMPIQEQYDFIARNQV
jgi:hypothetical protein